MTLYLMNMSAEEPNESITGLEEADETNNEDHNTETLRREDTDLDARRSERDLLLERLEEATDKSFEAYPTSELRKIWKAYAEDQEASQEAEIIFPQVRAPSLCRLVLIVLSKITRLETFEVALGGGYTPSKSLSQRLYS
jgi:DUF438 domain-containing protein